MAKAHNPARNKRSLTIARHRTSVSLEEPFWEALTELAREITEEVPGIVSVTYNVATKPPSTIEVV